jgi:DNA replication and repair protein RecF
MLVKRLAVENFRPYQRAELVPAPGITLIHGGNAQGKTALIEALYLCCTGRSHRTGRDAELIRTGEAFSRVIVEAERRDGRHDVEILIRQGQRKRIKVGGSIAARSGDLMGHVTGVLFSPEDLRMIKDGPAERRRFVDMELSQMRPSYYAALQRYNRALLQRGHLLRSGTLDGIDAWDEQLARWGAQIMGARLEFTQKLSVIARQIHAQISGGEVVTVQYRPGAKAEPEAEALFKLLRGARDQDVRRQTTSVGPHRDDLGFFIDGADARAFASQGQQRTLALSLKLSELQVMRDVTGEWPVLMLDDVMSELDPQRRRLLLERLDGVQTLIATTDPGDLAGARVDRSVRVCAGRLEG